jgi:hypothetical protein
VSHVLDELVDRLYGLPLENFVPERGALVKQLRAEGDRETAAAVGKLRKPTVAAWAVNQVVRSQRAAARALWEAGDGVAAAQAALMSGKAQRQDLADALARLRGALEDLTRAAEGLLDEQGRGVGPATIAKVGETLMAAAIDPGTRETIGAGRAVREGAPIGFGGLAGAEPAAAPRSRPAKRSAAASRSKEEAAARRAARGAAEQRLAAASAARRDAERALRDAEDAAVAAEREAAEAHERRSQAEALLEAARETEAEAARAVDAA